MKLCLLLLLVAASSVLAGPVPRTKMRRNTDQGDQGRLLPIAIFNNGVTSSTSTSSTSSTTSTTSTTSTSTTMRSVVVLKAEAVASATTASVASATTAAVASVTTAASAAKPAAGSAAVHAAVPAAPTVNVLQGLQPTSVDDLPPAAELAQLLSQQQNSTSGVPSFSNALTGIANWLNPFRVLSQNNLLTQSAALNQAQTGTGTQTGMYIWSPTSGAVPYNSGRKRVLDEPEQIDPNYLRLLQELYYSSRQNLQQSSYFPPQYSNQIGYPSPVGYTNPITNVDPYGQPQLSAYQSNEAPLYNSASPAANNPYYPMYLVPVPQNFEANGITQKIDGAGSATPTQVESKPGTIVQNTTSKIQIEKDKAKPEIGVQETAVEVDIEKDDTTQKKPDSEKEKTSESKTEKVPSQEKRTEQGKPHNTGINQPAGGILKVPSQESETEQGKPHITGINQPAGGIVKVPNQESGTEQSKPHNTGINQPAGGIVKVPNQDSGTENVKTHSTGINQPVGGIVKATTSSCSKTSNQSEPSNSHGNSKSYVKFSRDPTTQQQSLNQEHLSRSDLLPKEDSHGQLVSSYRLQQTSEP